MRKQEESNPTQDLTFKLSNNNSVLTLKDGTSFNINIEAAFINLMDDLPPKFELPETRHEILALLDDFTQHMPEDYPMGRYKNIYAMLNALGSFHHALLSKRNGGSHD